MVAAAMVLAAAAVTAAFAVVVVLPVVMAGGVGIILQNAGEQGLHRLVSIAGHSRIPPDACGGQRGLGAAPDAAADQNIRANGVEDAGQSAMAAALGVHHLGSDDGSVGDLIDLKLFRVAKMLENLAVFVCDCNFHDKISFF